MKRKEKKNNDNMQMKRLVQTWYQLEAQFLIEVQSQWKEERQQKGKEGNRHMNDGCQVLGFKNKIKCNNPIGIIKLWSLFFWKPA